MKCIAQGTLLNVSGNLDGRGVWGRRDARICMAESLCCLPETITTSLISYTPIQSKKFFFFKQHDFQKLLVSLG